MADDRTTPQPDLTRELEAAATVAAVDAAMAAFASTGVRLVHVMLGTNDCSVANAVTAALEAAEVAAQIVELARVYADFGDFCVEADTLLERYDALCGVPHNPSNGGSLWT